MKKIIIFIFFLNIAFSQVQISDSLRFYERQFDPSIYNIKSLVLPEKVEKQVEPQTVTGYRIQVAVTTSLDTANYIKELVYSVEKSQKVYIIYEPPYYKVRVGDFTTLMEASRFREFLARSGFKDAWVVMDKVYKK